MIPVHIKTNFLEEISLPTDWGMFRMLAFGNDRDKEFPHVVLIHPDTDLKGEVIVRIHSECMTGDLFHSQRCDCGPQMNKSLELISQEHGVFIYLRQEGRGIGLVNKMKAYNLQDLGRDTLEANLDLGLEGDGRRYEDAINILQYLKISKIKLMTNNPEKIEAIKMSNIEVIERLPLVIEPIEQNTKYLQTKREKFRHLI